MAANSGSAALIARTMDSYSRAQRQTEGAAASPALSLIPTPLDSTFDASSTPFDRQIRHRAPIRGYAHSEREHSGRLNKGFAIASDRLTRQRIPYAAGCIGVAIKAHAMALEYVPQRETFGAPCHRDKPSNGCSWTMRLISGKPPGSRLKPPLKRTAESRLERGRHGQVSGHRGRGRVVDRCMQMFGGFGVAKDFPFERWFREMRIRRIGEGPSEVQRHIIARGDSGRFASLVRIVLIRCLVDPRQVDSHSFTLSIHQ